MFSDSLAPTGSPDFFLISTQGKASMGEIAIGVGGSTLVSAAWPTANLALFYPFIICERHTYVRACLANAATVSGNFDIGIYDLDGNRLFSTGSTAQAGASQMQKVTISWTLDPGNYYIALVFNNITATVIRDPPSAPVLRAAGCKQMATAFPLPTTATLAGHTQGFLPVVGISEVSWL